MARVVVIGAGLAGLVASIRLADAGARVALLNKGTGGLQLSQGTVDILGYGPGRIERPLDALADFAPKVVVLGLQDKDSGGLELLSMIKAFNPAIEVLLLIGKGMAIAGMQGIERGAFDYIPQPIELGVLIGKIRKAAGVESDQ